MFRDTFYSNILFIVIIVTILSASSGYFRDQPLAHDIGLIIFLIFFIHATRLFQRVGQLTWEFLLFAGYGLALAIFFYAIYPYADHKEAVRPFFLHGITAFLSGAAYAPFVLFRALQYLSDWNIPRGYDNPAAHYPFVIGFYSTYALMTLAIKAQQTLSGHHPAPGLFTLTLYNFLIGAGFILLAKGATALVFAGAVMAGVSLLVWGYWYFPRFGIPTAFSSRRRQKEIERIGDDVRRSHEKLKKYLDDIDKI